jgi:hypothetical protein
MFLLSAFINNCLSSIFIIIKEGNAKQFPEERSSYAKEVQVC